MGAVTPSQQIATPSAGISYSARRRARDRARRSIVPGSSNLRSSYNGGGITRRFTNKWLTETDKNKQPFSEELYTTTFSKENIERLVNVTKTATETEINESTRLLEDNYIYSLQILSNHIPHVPMHLTRILLPHSLENEDSNICIFVKDLKRGRRRDYEPTVQHYEQLFKKLNIVGNITVMPMSQLFTEYATFELRRNLTFLFDKFLVDKSIAAHINGYLGHKLLSKCRAAIPINLNDPDKIAEEIDMGLRKVFYKYITNGITQMVQFGRHSMSTEHMAENLIDLIKQLSTKVHPGGSQNIFKLTIKPNVNISVVVPVFVNYVKPDAPVPVIIGTKDEIKADAAQESAEKLTKFEVTTSGTVQKVRRQGESVLAENMVIDDDDVTHETHNIVTSDYETKRKVTSPPKLSITDEAALSNLILKNIEKIVGKDKLAAVTAAAATQSAPVTPARSVSDKPKSPSRARPLRPSRPLRSTRPRSDFDSRYSYGGGGGGGSSSFRSPWENSNMENSWRNSNYRYQ